MHSGSFDPAIGQRIRRDEALVRALKEIGADAGALLFHGQRAWRSITFSGTRHRMTYGFEGQAAVERGEHLIAELPEHEFTIPGQLVADAAVVAASHTLSPPHLTVELELLLLEQA